MRARPPLALALISLAIAGCGRSAGGDVAATPSDATTTTPADASVTVAPDAPTPAVDLAPDQAPPVDRAPDETPDSGLPAAPPEEGQRAYQLTGRVMRAPDNVDPLYGLGLPEEVQGTLWLDF